jgi:hypothetical protein|eukprot:COSAG01_NODE_224_length_21376_cov_146.993702_10_plen_91_part_00
MATAGGAGTLGLVNDLSVKLAKQRKQLNGLVKDVKSAASRQARWYHYAGAVLVNNVVVVLLGILIGNWVYGIGSADGALTASKRAVGTFY